MPLISFDGLSVPLEEVQDNPARYATRLARAKKIAGYAVCKCKPSLDDVPLRPVVRRHGALFHLARWPEEGFKWISSTTMSARVESARIWLARNMMNELTLNYQNPLVGHIWQRCSDALEASASRAGT